MVGQRSKQQQGETDVDSERKKIELEEQLLNLQEKRLDLEQKRIELELRKLKLLTSSRKSAKKSKSDRTSGSRRDVTKSADEWSDNDEKLVNSLHSRGRGRHKSSGTKSSNQSEEESVGSDEDEGLGVAKSSDDDLIVDDSYKGFTVAKSTEVSQDHEQEGKGMKGLYREDSTVSQTTSSNSQSSADNFANASPPNPESNTLSETQRKSLMKNLETIGTLSQVPLRPSIDSHSREQTAHRSLSSPNTPVSVEKLNDKKDSKLAKVPRKFESTGDQSRERVVTRRSSIRGDEGKPIPVRERSADTRASTKTTKMSNESRGPADYENTSILDITSITVTADASGNKQETPSDNKRTGYFVYTWPDGRQYSGDWLDGKFHGQGTYTWPNGGRYAGAYKFGLKHGTGIYEWADGNKYDGEFKHGKRHGKGLQLNEDGSVFHNGAWREDEPVD
jgi:hypothetical protein